MRDVARTLDGAYSYPISSHVVLPDGALQSTFVGNSYGEGKRYIDFLHAAVEATAAKKD